jgi:CBS domain-containing protein/sporulation protein YlmC with PRC-barrel domain
MRKLSSFYLNKFLYKNVYDEDDEVIGKLWDVYVATTEGFPRVIGYQIKRGRELINCEFRSIDFYEDNNKPVIKVHGEREIIVQKFSYLLSKHLLGTTIVDINGKKLVKVNDLRIAELAAEYRVIAVDTGIMSLGRRYNVEKLLEWMFRFIKKKPEDTLIIWDNVESLEMVNNNLKLSVPYKKLSRLHPADLADILEDMDINYRKRVFESLEEDLAADTFEEIEPDFQADLLETMSESKREEVLDNMPNDEIADMLDDMDEETAERILLNMEKEDADEVRELMQYEDETVGSLMNKDFIAFNMNITAGETVELIKEMEPDDEVSHYIYMVDEEEKLAGVFSLLDLVMADGTDHLKDILTEDVVRVKDSDNIDEAINLATKYNLLSLPVVDEEEKLCGIIIMNDIIEEVFMPLWKRRFRKAV